MTRSSSPRRLTESEALHLAIERHLLLAQLARLQARTVERSGCFDLVLLELFRRGVLGASLNTSPALRVQR